MLSSRYSTKMGRVDTRKGIYMLIEVTRENGSKVQYTDANTCDVFIVQTCIDVDGGVLSVMECPVANMLGIVEILTGVRYTTDDVEDIIIENKAIYLADLEV